MAKKRITKRKTKTTKSSRPFTTERKGLDCKECGKFVDGLSIDTKTVTCDRCVAKSVAPPEFKDRPAPTGRPRGWQFKKEYIAEDGSRYVRGRKVDECDSKTKRPAKSDRKKSANAKAKKSKKNTKQSTAGKRRSRNRDN